MSKGRKKDPVVLKLLRGTKRADRENPDMPDAAPDGMKAPSWLPREAVEHFGVLKSRIEGLGLNSKTYTEALAATAGCLEEIEALTAIIIEEGYTYESIDESGKRLKKVNPAASQRREARRELRGWLSEFGLTPCAIQKVGGGGKKKESKFAEYMNG